MIDNILFQPFGEKSLNRYQNLINDSNNYLHFSRSPDSSLLFSDPLLLNSKIISVTQNHEAEHLKNSSNIPENYFSFDKLILEQNSISSILFSNKYTDKNTLSSIFISIHNSIITSQNLTNFIDGDDDDDDESIINMTDCEMLVIDCKDKPDLQKNILYSQQVVLEETDFAQIGRNDVIDYVYFFYCNGPGKNPTNAIVIFQNVGVFADVEEMASKYFLRKKLQQRRKNNNTLLALQNEESDFNWLKETAREYLLRRGHLQPILQNKSNYSYDDDDDDDDKVILEALRFNVKALTSKLTTACWNTSLKSRLNELIKPATKIKSEISNLQVAGKSNKKLQQVISSKMSDDALTNTFPIKITKTNKNLGDEIYKLKCNRITQSQFLKQLGVEFPPKQAKIIDARTKIDNLNDFPDGYIEMFKDKTKIFITKNVSVEDMVSANSLKKTTTNNPIYPSNKISIERELASNKSIKNLEKKMIKLVNEKYDDVAHAVTRRGVGKRGPIGKLFHSRFIKFVIFGSVGYGIFKFIVQPWLVGSAGCHLNYVNPNVPGKIISEKIVEFSCDCKDTHTQMELASHPFLSEISDWEMINPSGGLVESYDSQYFMAVQGYPHCSDVDVKTYGSCGGWGSFSQGYPLSTKFDASRLNNGTSITCDEAPGIFVAVADILSSAGAKIASGAVDVIANVGSNIIGGIKNKLLENPALAIGIAAIFASLVFYVTKKLFLALLICILIFVVYFVFHSVK